MGWVGLGFPHTAFQAALLMHKLLPPCVFSPWHTWSLTQHTLLGFTPASGNGHQFFWLYTEIQYTVLFPHAKCSKPAHKSLNCSIGFCLCSLIPSLSWSCAVRWTLVALLTPPHPEHQQPGRVVTGLETTAQSSCSGIGPASLLGNWKHQQLFSFFDFDFVKYIRK